MPETAETLHEPSARGLGIDPGTPVGTATLSVRDAAPQAHAFISALAAPPRFG
jgi:hypothetical protein